MKTQSTLGSRIRKAREEAGLRRKPVAAMADIHWKTLTKIELDSIPNPGAKTVAKLAQIIGCSTDSLLLG